MNAIIGHTGFVGSNIDKETNFDYKFNSKNINNIKGKDFDLLVCSAVRAEMWFANKCPDEDKKEIDNLINHLESINTKIFVLISTVGVYKSPINVDENSKIDKNELLPYGKNRLYLEDYVKNRFQSHLIIRLPALFGINIKKNFIFDLLFRVPTMLVEKKIEELNDSDIKPEFKVAINNSYKKDQYGFYILDKSIGKSDYCYLRENFNNINFTSLNFTHSESRFQFYYLKRLWNDINRALENDIKLLNITSEPLSAREIAKKCFGLDFDNVTPSQPFNYDMKSIYAKQFGGDNGYLYLKEAVLNDLKTFVLNYQE